MIKNVFLIITPFQYKMMKEVFPAQLQSENSLLIFNEKIAFDTEYCKGLVKQHVFEGFSFNDLKRKPFQKIKEYRKAIAELQDRIKKDFEKLKLADQLKVIIGTDKDIYTQLLLGHLHSSEYSVQDIKVSAVEEGLGYYVNETRSDQFKRLLYQCLTPLLFGTRLYYYRQLGTDHRIDELYVRLPEALPRRRKANEVPVHKIKDSGHDPVLKETVNSKAVLIFSFPNQDFAISDQEKKEIFLALLSKFPEASITVKPHPRESTEVFEEFEKIKVMPGSMVGEKLDYFQFGTIVNFASSIIIDILQKNYPVDRIYTVFINPVGLSFFQNTKCIKLKDLKQSKFEVDSE